MNKDINYYDWVPFFGEICEKIQEFADDEANRESKLLGFAEKIFPTGHNLLLYATIDPFSFIYALAQRNTIHQREEFFDKARIAFGLDSSLPTDNLFPTPTPNTPSSFFKKGIYKSIQGKEVGNNCLWNLFQQVKYSNQVDSNLFKKALSLKYVGISKLSQVFFLINPSVYFPLDSQMKSLPLPEIGEIIEIVETIESEGIIAYFKALEKIKKFFPKCLPYEINLLNYLVNLNTTGQLLIKDKYCQVSSYVQGQNKPDYFEEFVKQNGVWTGGEESTSGFKTYPVIDFTVGDIVLVRRGTKNLGGIGVIVNNQYLPNGFEENKMLQIIWLNKEYRYTPDALAQWDGFSKASAKTLDIFKTIYPETFKILNLIKERQKKMINFSKIKHKNFILQGPPGTGKTRLAKQIAHWLSTEGEKEQTVFEVVEKQFFTEEADIEGNEQIKLIQFHPSYTYEDFVRGIAVNADNDKLKYEVKNRLLAEFAEEASKPENQQKAFILIIDEINRANLPSVLGELIYALEYRGKSMNSIYKYKNSHEIILPHNLYVIGTMNTADRSVGHIDYAIRRRFAFIDIPAQRKVIEENAPHALKLYDEVEKLFSNDSMASDFEAKDVKLGHSYFLTENIGDLKVRFKYEILPILQEYRKDGILTKNTQKKIEKLDEQLN
ncbi:McrB family protein [Gillisia sp. Q332]|uniref:McrB family protein n=1 Tax=Gillisia xinjiangensis TaxID=3384765 RepID=UPI00391D4A10